MNAVPSAPLRILLLEDNPDDVALVERELRKLEREVEVSHVETQPDFQDQLTTFAPDIVLSDHSLPGYSGSAALEFCQIHAPLVPFIFVSGTMGEEVAIRALQEGAVDYVLKQRLQGLVPAVTRAMREAEERAVARRDRSELEKTQRLLQSLIDHSPALISVRDPSGRLLMTNDPFNQRFGQSSLAGDAAGSETSVAAASLPVFEEHDREVLRQQMPVVREHNLDSPEGSQTFLSVRFPLHDVHGDIEAVCGIDMDITERKHAEEQLREQANILNQASDTIFVTDAAGKISYCNEAAQEKSGFRREEIIGRRLEELFSELTASFTDEVRKITMDSGTWHGEIKVRNRRDELLWLDVRVVRIMNHHTSDPAFVMTCTDITEKKSLEEQFLRVQRLESIGMLSAGIAHDLNNVLAPVGMVATLLRSRLQEDREIRMLDTLEKSAERGAGLIKQILAFAQGVKGELRETQIKHIGRDVAEMIRETFPKTISFVEDIPANLWVMNANPSQIHQIILNLCVNARDAMPAGGSLRLQMSNSILNEDDASLMQGASAGEWVCITVQDTGEGISAEIREKIFSPFFSTKPSDKGTGLGLSTVRGIVESHRGFIHLESEVGAGSTFRVFLPATVRQQDSSSPFMDEVSAPGHGELVLVAEDEEMIRTLVAEALNQAGYEVITAADGAIAAELFMQRHEEVALVLSDIMMPNYGGDFLIQAVLAIKPSVKIIAMTGLSDEEVSSHGALGLKVSTWLKKPFEVSDLVRVVAAQLRDSQSV